MKFDDDEIILRIRSIQERWKDKYPMMSFKTANLKFDSLVAFNLAYTTEIELLNMEQK
jgi:hypothetical protein